MSLFFAHQPFDSVEPLDQHKIHLDPSTRRFLTTLLDIHVLLIVLADPAFFYSCLSPACFSSL